ncbi:MAG: mucoidy inhibitor MuiA family protein [Deltaproteobacteria bacterium]|nr:mucoidy inhibitor MuiA family protein [Deltaproteobacteria bacterium]
MVQTEIAKVTVYSDSAHVTRRAKVRLRPGLVTVEIPDLPESVQVGALRVSADGAQVRSVEATTSKLSKPSPEKSELLARLRSIEARRTQVMGEIGGLESELALLDAIGPKPGREPDGSPRIAPLRPDRFLAGLQIMSLRQGATSKALRTARAALKKLNRQQVEARAMVQLFGAEPENQARRVLRLGLEPTAADVTLELTYSAAWATWRPHYQLRITPGSSTLTCVRFGDVWQSTGEDWLDVDARLSTSQAIDGLWIPSARPWIIEASHAFTDETEALYDRAPRGHEPAPELLGDDDDFAAYAEQFESEGIYAEVTSTGAMAGRFRTLSSGLTDSDRAPETRHHDLRRAPALPSLERRPELEGRPSPFELAGGFNHEIDIPNPMIVYSKGTHARFLLGQMRLPVELEYVLRPAVRSTAHARAKVTNPEAIPLLGGAASVLVEGPTEGPESYRSAQFVGETHLQTTPSNGTLILDLGAQTAIESVRRTKTTVKSVGLLSREERHLVEVTIEIVNHLPAPAKVLIEDQIPTTDDERIRLDLEGTEPKEADWDPKTGVIRLSATLASGERRVIGFSYSIQLPRELRAEMQLAEPVR